MAYTTINKPSDYFNTVLYTGTGSTLSITGVGFAPDLTWVKRRSSARGHTLCDQVRGDGYNLYPDLTGGQSLSTGQFTSLDSDGFTLGADDRVNQSSGTHVSWNWLADNTSGSSNTDGSITSTVSANTTSGFSIVSYTGNGTAGATIGHGLGATPSMIIVKNLSTAEDWRVYHTGVGNTNALVLNSTTTSTGGTGMWNNTSPTSSYFSVGTHPGVNGSGNNLIAYCFAEKKGFSKFGTYSGAGGGVDGKFIYLGFKPALVIIKSYDGAYGWVMNDNKRNPYNEAKNTLFANNTDAEDPTYNTCDLLSNGFKLRSSAGVSAINSATQDGLYNYIYMAFAEHPLVSSTGVPCTAR